MRVASRTTFLVSSTILLLACGGGGSGTGGHGGTSSSSSSSSSGSSHVTDLPCDVNEILVSRCQECHQSPPRFGAPMPLVTHADLVAAANSDPAKKVYELVAARTHDDASPMPQPPAPRLDATEQKVIDDFAAAGAPASSATCGTGGSGGTGGGGPSCTPDITLRPTAGGYTMPDNVNDMYICYGVDVTVAAKRHITTFMPFVDNSTIVHHIVLFESDTAAPAGPTPCGFGGTTSRIVAVWAPGNPGFTLPPEAGLPIEGTTHYVLQVHYNNLMHLAGQVDGSGFDLCTTDQLRPNDADVLAFGTANFTVPAHGSLDVTCDFQIPAAAGQYHIVGAMPHMHKLGKVIETKNVPGGSGTPVDIGSRNPWDFNTQYWSPVNAVVSGGDMVKTRCSWTNGGDTDVHFGENTEDEMCFTFEMYYPKIALPQWNWAVPAYTSKCAPTP